MKTVVKKICSGGQQGADIAALDFAIKHGIAHGGWCPKGRRCDGGTISEQYKLREHPSDQYPPRTLLNVLDSQATIVFAWDPQSAGTALTIKYCKQYKRPYLVIEKAVSCPVAAAAIQQFIGETQPRILNIAGNRERKQPGIHDFVVACLDQCLDLFAKETACV